MQVTPNTDGTRARIRGELRIRLDNNAPVGVASFALGPWDERFAAGENRSFVSVYTPLRFTSARFGGAPMALEVDAELGRNVYSALVSVHAGSAETLVLQLEGTVDLEPGGWYVLDLPRQPTLRADRISLEVDPGPGWKIVDARGLRADSSRARGTLAADADAQVAARLEEEAGDPGLRDRLAAGKRPGLCAQCVSD